MKRTSISMIVGLLVALAVVAASRINHKPASAKSKAAAFLEMKAERSVSARAELEKAAPGLYAEITSASIADAKEKYATLAPALKRLVWKAKLIGADVTGWSDEHIDYLADTIEALPRVEFTGSEADKALARGFTTRLKQLSPNGGSVARSFFELGNPLALQKIKAPARGAFPHCSCAGGWDDFCNWNRQGSVVNFSCEPINCDGGLYGCGWLWTGWCNGQCGF
jgi:hypothetical protein